MKSFQYTFFLGLLQTLKIIHNEKHFSLPDKKSTDILNYHTKGSQLYNFAPPNVYTYTYVPLFPSTQEVHTYTLNFQTRIHTPHILNYVRT
jgi:hypothetical protein